jgi:hypothetical protein
MKDVLAQGFVVGDREIEADVEIGIPIAILTFNEQAVIQSIWFNVYFI